MPHRTLSAYDTGLSYFPDDGNLLPPRLGMSLGTEVGAIVGAAVGGPAGSTVGGGAGSFIANLFGGTGKYGTPQSEGAEQARVDMALLGAQHGSVQSAQFLLGQSQSDTSNYAQHATQVALATLQVGNPDIYNAAEAAGPLYDTADGVGVMTNLINLGVAYTGQASQYAGYNTTTTQPGSPQALALAQKVKTVSALSSVTGALSSGFMIPGTTTKVPLVLIAGAGIALFLALNKKRSA